MPYVIGLDFGTESGRALLVDVHTGEELAAAVHEYPHGVIDRALPDGTPLGPDWALQNPDDYLDVLRTAVPEVLRRSGVDPEQVIGIGVDATACTIIPTLRDGVPLCSLERWRPHPHAWAKLWKHHASQPQAEKITDHAYSRNEPWIERYGGTVSSEWLHSKVLQIVEEAPEVYEAAERIVEAGDWVVWRMTGTLLRNSAAAGYKALWEKGRGFPDIEFLTTLDARLATLNHTRLAGEVVPPGTPAGGLTAEAAAWMGLPPGIAVSAATIDAHASVPGAGVTEPGTMVLILGTSTCHMLMGHRMNTVPGISGVVEEGIIPVFFGYEAGQAATGDILEWFVGHCVPPPYHQLAAERNVDLYAALEHEAAKLQPGESGLLALDWWNGNRSVLTDASLSGMILGMTLATRAPDIYRALIEATAFGTRVIIENFERYGVVVNEMVGCGGLAERNGLLMQIYADVTGREFRQAGSGRTSALGAAMFGAVAAGGHRGGHDSITAAADAMTTFRDVVYRPDRRRHELYNGLYREYLQLHEHFGRGANDVMRRLRRPGALTDGGS